MSFFGLGGTSSAHIEIALNEDTDAKWVNGKRLYSGSEDVAGTVVVTPTGAKGRLEHQGIKIELLGRIKGRTKNGSLDYKFTSLVRDLCPPGVLHERTAFDFSFNSVEKEFESYAGKQVKLRYYLRVKVHRSYNTALQQELDFKVQNITEEESDVTANSPVIKQPVGIADCLHIEFEFPRSHWYLDDIVEGQIDFKLVRIKVEYMELSLLRVETVGSGKDRVTTETRVCDFEVMDGAPIKGESIPIRLFLKPLTKLSPSFGNVHNKFSVNYFLKMTLVDDDKRNFFKKCPITLLRRQLKYQTTQEMNESRLRREQRAAGIGDSATDGELGA
ncbi:MAG: hypothetical protein MHM6MM_003391 [Cercozoa sp. M6MM]